MTVRKAENLPNEVALILGFAARAGAQAASAGARGGTDPAMIVGTTTYGLVVKEANAWLSNPADEPKAVGEIGAGPEARRQGDVAAGQCLDRRVLARRFRRGDETHPRRVQVEVGRGNMGGARRAPSQPAARVL